MANTPRKNNVTKTVPVSNKEVEYLKSQLAEMTKKFDALFAMLPEIKEDVKTEAVTNLPGKDVFTEERDYVDILPNKRIKVISLYDGILSLTTGDGGQGKPYVFTKFGQSHNITWSDLSEILHYHHSFADKGYFYICDKNVISNENLTDVYNTILTKEIIDNLFNYSEKDMVDYFKSTTDEQKEVIVSMIAIRLAKGEKLDLNKTNALERSYGKRFTESIMTAENLQAS